MTKKKELNFLPYGNWLVLPDPTTRKTESGIILDDAAAKALVTNILEVLATGPSCIMAEIGDEVMVNPMADAMKMTINGIPCVLVSEHNLLGKFDKN